MTITKHVGRILIFLASILLSVLSHYFLNGWINVIPWGIVTIYIGYISVGRRNIVINGAIFGYFLFLIYILIGYGGKTDAKSLTTFIPFTLVFSILGSAAGIIGAFIGNFVKQQIKSRYKTNES